MAKKKAAVKPGDLVSWNTSQGKTTGKVTKRVTETTKAKGHTAKATKANPQFEVVSDKSGKNAVHRPEQLRKAAKKR